MVKHDILVAKKQFNSLEIYSQVTKRHYYYQPSFRLSQKLTWVVSEVFTNWIIHNNLQQFIFYNTDLTLRRPNRVAKSLTSSSGGCGFKHWTNRINALPNLSLPSLTPNMTGQTG